MGLDIFGRNQTKVGGVFSADNAVLAVVGGSGANFIGALVQGIQSSYQQDYRDLYELGSTNVYHVIGRAKGRLSLNNIIGGKSLGFDKSFYDACNSGSTLSLRFTPSGCDGIGGSLTCIYTGIFVTNKGVTATAEDLLVRSSVEMVFNSYNEVETA